MAQEYNTSLIPVATNFMKTLEVPFTKKILKQRLETNPYYPSLYSLSEIFKWYHIENRGLRIEKEQLDELSFPFLAYVYVEEIGSKDFVNVTNITNTSVTYYYGKEKTISREEFINDWSRIVFLAEKTNKSKEQEYEKNKSKADLSRKRIIFLLLGFAAVMLPAIYSYLSDSSIIFNSMSFLLFTLAGLSVSVLLLIYEIDQSNVFVKNICTGGIKTNCNAVLGSKAARLFGISWGEVGFFYFCSLTLFLLLPALTFPDKTPYLSYLSVLSAGYIPFSIYYQYRIVKQWCRLCLLVQSILFLNLVWVLAFGDFAISFNINTAVFFIICLIIPILSWYSLKPTIIRSKNADKFYNSYRKLITQPEVFKAKLSDQDDLPGGWENLSILKGRSDAENVIFKVCSPGCGHCFKAHAVFNDILSSNDNVKLYTIYMVTNNEGDPRSLPVKHFLALAETGKAQELEQAMNYWYLTEDRNYDTLKNKYPVTEEVIAKQGDKINQMREWCKAAEIEYTPTVFINGKKLPATFSIDDLKDVF